MRNLSYWKWIFKGKKLRAAFRENGANNRTLLGLGTPKGRNVGGEINDEIQ